MYMVFLDEAGYSPDWKSDVENQPFYSLSAVCLPSDRLSEAYQDTRNTISSIDMPGERPPLGKGFEIKSSDIVRGSGWWHEHNDERNLVRNTFLEMPCKYDGTAILVIIDKRAHLDKYASPDNPYMLALEFIMERIDSYLARKGDLGYCIYDHNKRIVDMLDQGMANLTAEGTSGIYYNRYFGEIFEFRQEINNILELSFGNSANSIGLQSADYYATLSYQYYKKGQPEPCGWWDSLTNCLDTKDGKADGDLLGYGLKLFPRKAFF